MFLNVEEATICNNEMAFCIRVINVKKHTSLGIYGLKSSRRQVLRRTLRLQDASQIADRSTNYCGHSQRRKSSEDYPSTRTVTADSLQLKACHFRV